MSELQVMKNTAPRLQRGPSMKSIFVGLLAVFALTGCGVGMDDIEGEQAVSAKAVNGLAAGAKDNSLSAQAGLRGPVNGDPRYALPQDPIPVFESKAFGPGGPLPLPSK